MPPVLRLTPESATMVADAGDVAATVLRRWGYGSATKPLEDAAALLRRVAGSGSFGAQLSAWDTVAEATLLISDWYAVTLSLPAEPIPSMTVELNAALLGGSSGQKGSDVLSQLWFGTLLTQARLQPQVPPPHGRRPDFIVTTNGRELAVEAKRPRTRHSALRCIAAAAAQMRDAGRSGYVVIDLSLALELAAVHHRLVPGLSRPS